MYIGNIFGLNIYSCPCPVLTYYPTHYARNCLLIYLIKLLGFCCKRNPFGNVFLPDLPLSQINKKKMTVINMKY